jgi:hypothetical protein
MRPLLITRNEQVAEFLGSNAAARTGLFRPGA